MIPAIPALNAAIATTNSVGSSTNPAPEPGHFLSLVADALHNVSTQEINANTAEASYAAGVPGATLSKALVASDRANIAWNATVAVRNEVVSAYQTIMNMQF